MNGLSQREHYARWDRERTRCLICNIIYEPHLKEKMISLIEKHHKKTKRESCHLNYGAMKEFAEKMGLKREDSRPMSIKMINIVKSFSCKKGLKRMFFQGWDLAERVRQSANSNTSKTLRNENRVVSLTHDQTLLNDLIENITLKVLTFARVPNNARTRKGSKSETGQRAPKNRDKQATMPEPPTPSAGGAVIEGQFQDDQIQSLDLNYDQLSRASLSGSDANAQLDLDHVSIESGDTNRRLRENYRQIQLIPFEQDRQTVNAVFEHHLAILNQQSRNLTPEVKDFILKFMTNLINKKISEH